MPKTSDAPIAPAVSSNGFTCRRPLKGARLPAARADENGHQGTDGTRRARCRREDCQSHRTDLAVHRKVHGQHNAEKHRQTIQVQFISSTPLGKAGLELQDPPYEVWSGPKPDMDSCRVRLKPDTTYYSGSAYTCRRPPIGSPRLFLPLAGHRPP